MVNLERKKTNLREARVIGLRYLLWGQILSSCIGLSFVWQLGES